jgi:hypothetical protein
MWRLGAPVAGERSLEGAKARAVVATERMTGVFPNPAFITARGTDVCVVCGADTGVPSGLDIEFRRGYTVGAGQTCARCAAD